MLSLPEMKILSKKTYEKHRLNFSCSAPFHMKNRACLEYFVNDCGCEKCKNCPIRNTSGGLVARQKGVFLKRVIKWKLPVLNQKAINHVLDIASDSDEKFYVKVFFTSDHSKHGTARYSSCHKIIPKGKFWNQSRI